jgi:glutamate racemase
MNFDPQKNLKIGLFDSGIGGFSILNQLVKKLPDAEFFYFSDDANAPYGPKSDDFITKRAITISEELFNKEVDIIVVACNTATASSIDFLRENFKDKKFVGVEPYLNAYYKMPDGEKKMVVLTTVSTGKSERFKRLRDRLDPAGLIEHVSLVNLARLIEEFYSNHIDAEKFKISVSKELDELKDKKYTHAILGCTHYPLISGLIEANLNLKTISPCEYVARRVCELIKNVPNEKSCDVNTKKINYCSSRNNQWIEMNLSDCILPFKKLGEKNYV